MREIVQELFVTGVRGPGAGRAWYLPEYHVSESVFGPGPEPYKPTPPLDAAQLRLLDILRQRIAPDFALAGNIQSDGLTFIHRKSGELDIYFVTNLQPKPSRAAVAFRVTGKRPECWDPMTGIITPVLHYRPVDAGVEVLLDLPQWGSTFIVFRPGADAIRVSRTNLRQVRNVTPVVVTGIAESNGSIFVEVEHNGRIRTAKGQVSGLPAAITLTGTWKMVLEGEHFTRLERTAVRLFNWSEDAATRHFSGTASYELDFELPPGYIREDLELALDLGAVGAIAEVSLNGQYPDVCWMQPYQIDITAAARRGQNRLQVLVTNTLANYVAGLQRAPEIPASLVSRYGAQTDVYPEGARIARIEMTRRNLPVSGLIGPVRIVPSQRVTLNLGG